MVFEKTAAPSTKLRPHVGEVSATRAWNAVLAPLLLFASSVANAETVQILDDRGASYSLIKCIGLLAPQRLNVRIAGPCVSACTILLGLYSARKDLHKFQGLFGFHLATPELSRKICCEPII